MVIDTCPKFYSVPFPGFSFPFCLMQQIQKNGKILKCSLSRWNYELFQIDRLSREHERETDELTEKVKKLQEDKAAIKEQAKQKTEALELELKSLQDNSAETINSLTKNIRYTVSLVLQQY